MATARKLDNLVLDHLFSSPVCTVDEVHRSLQKRGQKFTVQAIYYEFRKLRERRVVIKAGNRFLLRLPWVTELQDRIVTALGRYRNELEKGALIELFEKKTVLKARSLHELQITWNSLVRALFLRHPDLEYFEWSPYAWFMLTPGNFEAQVLEQHRRDEIPFNLILGRKCFLNSLYLKQRASLPGTACLGDAPVSSFHRKYLSVHGDGVITISIDRGLEAEIHRIFNKTRGNIELSSLEIGGLVNRDANISIKIELDPPKAEKLRREFSRVFARQLRLL